MALLIDNGGVAQAVEDSTTKKILTPFEMLVADDMVAGLLSQAVDQLRLSNAYLALLVGRHIEISDLDDL